jgi:hypothetical protein
MLAYYRNTNSDNDVVGSMTGDPWDSVLQTCGYDVSEFHQGYQRRAEYVGGYTREKFQALWIGRENQCPYWDDAPWPP